MHEEGPRRPCRPYGSTALSRRRLSHPQDVDYISTHGTSTSENDSIETLAIKIRLGDHAKASRPLQQPKSLMGHLIGAAGVCRTDHLRDGHAGTESLPLTMNLNDPDPELDLDYVPNAPRKAER
jgi:3-oxoacyl-[acyl-carrier-protein] synthase II